LNKIYNTIDIQKPLVNTSVRC